MWFRITINHEVRQYVNNYTDDEWVEQDPDVHIFTTEEKALEFLKKFYADFYVEYVKKSNIPQSLAYGFWDTLHAGPYDIYRVSVDQIKVDE